MLSVLFNKFPGLSLQSEVIGLISSRFDKKLTRQTNRMSCFVDSVLMKPYLVSRKN